MVKHFQSAFNGNEEDGDALMIINRRRTRKSWLSNQRVRSGSLLIWTIVPLLIFTVGCTAQAQRPAPSIPQGPVRVQLFDAYSTLALANTDVEVTSDDGIIGFACVPTYQCAGNHKTWSGRSDDSGVLVIPSSVIQFHNDVKAKDHQVGRLTEDAIKDSSHTHQIELYPEWLSDDQYEWIRGYKLLAARSRKVLANTPVRLEFPMNDWPGQHGGTGGLDVRTNSLGFVFFSFLRKPEPKLGQPSPAVGEAQWMTEEAWVIVSGYRKARLNYFAGSADEKSVIRLRQ